MKERTQALRSRFARVRVRAAHRDHLRDEVRAPEWLLIEWPKGDTEPLKYWLSTLPEDMPLQRMVFEAKMRWRIERDYQDLKQDLGLGHYEGRGWRGFHHHASLSIAAYGFLVAQRLRHPDEVGGKKNSAQRQDACPTHTLQTSRKPSRAQRHVPSSITSLRMRIGSLLAQTLPRCPCCLRVREGQFTNTVRLVVGEVVDDIRIPHKGNIQGEVIEGAFRVLDEFEAVSEHTEAMKALQLAPPKKSPSRRLRWRCALVRAPSRKPEGIGPPR